MPEAVGFAAACHQRQPAVVVVSSESDLRQVAVAEEVVTVVDLPGSSWEVENVEDLARDLSRPR